MKPFLSIVIANYNYGHFLQEALDSIFGQCLAPVTWKDRIVLPVRGCAATVEVIVCDAASSDNSVEVIKANSDKIAWWCSEKDGGQSAAFNKGFSHAQGEWLTWLNADDVYLRNTFHELFRVYSHNPQAQWITGNKIAFDSDTRRIERVYWGPHRQPPLLNGRRAFSAVFGPATFWKRSLYLKMGPIDECLHYAMDSEYWARFTLSGIRQVRLNHFCWGFRHHVQSKTAGEQTEEVARKRSAETAYWHKKLGFSFPQSMYNPFYVMWIIWRCVDGSWIKRFYLKWKLEGRAIERFMVQKKGLKARVAILNEKIMPYRVPIYDLLSRKYDLTLVHSASAVMRDSVGFKTLAIRPARKFGPFYIHPDDMLPLCNQYDAVIVLGEIRRLSLISLAFRKRNVPVAFWSIGVSTGRGFDACKRWDWVRDYIYKKADACIFYTDYARNRAIRKGYSSKAVFVADNTVRVTRKMENVEKDSFLFIGTLYAAKGIFVLLESYEKALQKNPSLPVLNIVGAGGEYEKVKAWVCRKGLCDHVKLRGSVFGEKDKMRYFCRAHICISPRQAGLSVLEAMGYGVPFVTMANAITGGERLNIIDGETGVLLRQESDLVDVLLDVSSHPAKYREMGSRAYEYYWSSRTPEHMADGLSRAVDYLLSMKGRE